jgi:hypothetical protein
MHIEEVADGIETPEEEKPFNQARLNTTHQRQSSNRALK